MFKVWMTDDNITYSTNSLEFNTIEEALNHARDVYRRWLGCKGYEILPLDDKYHGHVDASIVGEDAL